MSTNEYLTANAVLAKLADAPTDTLTVRNIRQRMSKGQQDHLDRALSLLTSQGDVEVIAPPPGRTKPGRKVRLLRRPTPSPHCPTCTCHDVL